MQTTQKELIFKIIDSLMKYMDKQAFLEVKLAFLLDCIDMGGKEHAKCKKQRWAYADSKMQL